MNSGTVLNVYVLYFLSRECLDYVCTDQELNKIITPISLLMFPYYTLCIIDIPGGVTLIEGLSLNP